MPKGKNIHMDVSENSGTPKSSILIGFSIINHPFWGPPIFGNTHILPSTTFNSSFFVVILDTISRQTHILHHSPPHFFRRFYWGLVGFPSITWCDKPAPVFRGSKLPLLHSFGCHVTKGSNLRFRGFFVLRKAPVETRVVYLKRKHALM